MSEIGIYAFPVVRNEAICGCCLVNWCEEKNCCGDGEQDKFHGGLLKVMTAYVSIVSAAVRSIPQGDLRASA